MRCVVNKATQQPCADPAWQETNLLVDDISRAKVRNIMWRCDTAWVTDMRGSMEDVIRDMLLEIK
jgi:hypothetical protein